MMGAFHGDVARRALLHLLGAQALVHTDSLGVIHRDVKPLNILCSNPRRIAKLAEFYGPLRTYSIHVGTRYYKSPETLLDNEYSEYSTNVWAVGVMPLVVPRQKVPRVQLRRRRTLD
jgi:casein kinase II subunit alpha